MRKPRRRSGNCAKCGIFRISLHRDHIVPRFLSGSDDSSNIQELCANCHEDKTREDNKAFRHSVEVKAALGAACHQRWQDPVYRARESAKRVGRKPWNKGIPMTEEAKQKLSASLTGKSNGPRGPYKGQAAYASGYAHRLKQQQESV